MILFRWDPPPKINQNWHKSGYHENIIMGSWITNHPSNIYIYIFNGWLKTHPSLKKFSIGIVVICSHRPGSTWLIRTPKSLMFVYAGSTWLFSIKSSKTQRICTCFPISFPLPFFPCWFVLFVLSFSTFPVGTI